MTERSIIVTSSNAIHRKYSTAVPVWYQTYCKKCVLGMFRLVWVLTIFNDGVIGHLSQFFIRTRLILVRLWNHAQIYSWNQPVLRNEGNSFLFSKPTRDFGVDGRWHVFYMFVCFVCFDDIKRGSLFDMIQSSIRWYFIYIFLKKIQCSIWLFSTQQCTIL